MDFSNVTSVSVADLGSTQLWLHSTTTCSTRNNHGEQPNPSATASPYGENFRGLKA